LESPMNRIHPPDVYVADTLTGKGRGVFAGRDFREAEVVEVAPVIVIENGATEILRQTILRTYDFDWQVLAGPMTSTGRCLPEPNIEPLQSPVAMAACTTMRTRPT